MADTAVRDKLLCWSCQQIFIDPVTLPCGHSCCRICLEDTWGNKPAATRPSCPQCGRTFTNPPELKRNLTLQNLAKHFLPPPTHPSTQICCTHCTRPPVPASRTCLYCETSLCESHVRVHSKQQQHVLIAPTATPGDRKCPIHKEILEYYCPQDAVCICESCYRAGAHDGHKVELLTDVSVRKKETLKTLLERLTPRREVAEERLQRLQEHKRVMQKTADTITETFLTVLRDIGGHPDLLLEQILNEISRKEEKLLQEFSDLIQKVEIQKGEFSWKILYIEELCKLDDPLTLLQEWESHVPAFWDVENGHYLGRKAEGEDIKAPISGDLEEEWVSETLLKGLADMIDNAERKVAKDFCISTHYAHTNGGLVTTVRFPSLRRNCPKHNELLKLYCWEHEECICVSCFLAGGHGGHKVDNLKVASGKKKEKLQVRLEKFRAEREETERRGQRLQEARSQVQGKAAGEAQRVTALLGYLRQQLHLLQKQIPREIKWAPLHLSDQLQEMIWNSRGEEVRHIEVLCTSADPFTVLRESDKTAPWNAEEGDDGDKNKKEIPGVGEVYHKMFLEVTNEFIGGLERIVTAIQGRLYWQETTDMLLDINTAGTHITLSGDRKGISASETDQNHPPTPDRFQSNQVLSACSFPSGRHYWEVEGSELGGWGLGVAYPSIEREGEESLIGHNSKSWALGRENKNYSVIHNGTVTPLNVAPSCGRIQISLDYEAGRLSFHELSEPIRHLHTFTAKFTERLHSAFWVNGVISWLNIITGLNCPPRAPEELPGISDSPSPLSRSSSLQCLSTGGKYPHSTGSHHPPGVPSRASSFPCLQRTHEPEPDPYISHYMDIY